MRLLRRLHNLSQNPAHILGMEEEYQRPMRANAGLAQHALAHGLKLGLGGVDIGHFIAHMMLATCGFLARKPVMLVLPGNGSISSICVPAVPFSPGVSTKQTFNT